MDEDDINIDGGGFTDIDDLTERSTGPTEPGRTPEPFDPVELPPSEDILTEENVFEMLMAIMGGTQGVPEGITSEVLASLQGRQIDTQAQLESAITQIVTESFDRAQEIVDTMVDDPQALTDMEDPGELSKLFIEQGGMSFAGVAPPTASTTTVTGREVVVTEGGGISGNIFDILETGGQVFGQNVPVVQYDPETGEPLRDENGDVITEDEYRPGILDVMIPHLPGISLPNWMPSAGVIFLPTIQEAVNKVWTIIDETDIGEAWEEGDIGEVLNDIGEIIVRSGESAAGVLEEKVSEIIGAITGAISDPTKAGAVLGGVIGTAFPSIPQWLPPLILDPRVYGAVRNVLTQNFNTPDEDFPLITEEEQDPTLMFTNRGDNYFVSSEGDEYFQLAESEDIDFEFNGQYTRQQLEDTGLETINSGTYQSLLDDLSFHALEEDIYQYSMDDLIERYESEGGILPGDWKVLDEESRYNFFLDDYFDIPTYIEEPDRDPAPEPEPQPEPEPEPDTGVFSEEQESVIRSLFADIIGEASLATTADIATGVMQVLRDSGIIDAEGNVIRPDLQGSIITALTNVGILNEDGQFIQQVIPDIQTEVLSALTTAGILDEEGNVIRQEPVDVEAGVTSALQTLGLVDADGQLSLDVSDSVLLALQNAGIVDDEGNVIEQDISGQFLSTLQDVGLVDEEGNIIRQEAPDIEGGVISALQTLGVVNDEGQLSLDVSDSVLLALQNAGIVDADGNVIEQDLTDQFVTTLQQVGVIDEEGASLLATSSELASLRDELVASGVIGEDVTVASQADLDNLVTALTESGLLGEDAIFATTGDINSLRDDLVAAGLIGEGADVATATDLANLRSELAAAGLIGEDAIDFDETVRTALSEFGFTDAQLEQISGAIDIPAGLSGEDIAQLFTDADLSTATNVSDAVTAITGAIDALDIPSLEEIKTALAEYGFTDAQLDQIAGAIDIPAGLSSEDIAQLFVDADLSTATNVSDAVTTITDAISNLDVDTTVRTALSEFAFTDDQLDQISGAIDIPANLSGEEITQLFVDANLATATNVTDAVNSINLSLSNLGFATPDNVRDILSEYAFSDAQINQIVSAIPAGLQLTDIGTLIDTALTGVATTEGLNTATTTITDAISGLNFATDANVRTALSEFRFNEDQLNQISALMPDTLTENELTLALNASLENIPTNADMDEAFLSITNSLSAGFSAITGEDGVLERQTTMLNAIDSLAEGQRDILTGQEGLLSGQEQLGGIIGEETQRLEDMILSSTGLLAAIGTGGFGGAPARPTPQPYRPYMEKLDYAPGMVEALKPQQQIDYNKEVDRLLAMGMGGKKQGMLV